MEKFKVLAGHASGRGRKRYVLRYVSVFMAVVLAVCAGVVGWFVWDTEQSLVARSVDLGVGVDVEEISQVAPVGLGSFEGAFTVLLVGEDSGSGSSTYGSREHVLNDVTILVHVAEDHETATAISFPRDLLVDFPECVDPVTGVVVSEGEGKLNTALSRGGLGCAVDTVSQIVGHPVPYAVMVGFDGVIALSDAVGGVKVCVTEDINDRHSGLVLSAGEHELQGEQALAFLRTRYGVGDGSDLSRISNQQVFLSSLLRELMSKGTLSDPVKVLRVAEAVSQNTVLSSNLASVSVLASVAYGLKDLNLDKVAFVQPATVVEGNAVVLLEEEADELFGVVFSGAPVGLTGGTGPGDVGSVKVDAPVVEVVSVVVVSGSAGVVLDAPESGLGTPEGGLEEPVGEVSDDGKVEVSEGVRGQIASEYTCSKGYIG